MFLRTLTAIIILAALSTDSASAAKIVADPTDFEVFATGPGGSNLGDFGVGDTGGGLPDQGRRGVMSFSLAGLNGVTIQTAVLTLFIIESRQDQYPAPGIIDSTPPITNPGLGDTLVIHIADYGTPKGAAYNSPSIGNDPGVLIGAGTHPGSRTVSIDVSKAMQQAVSAGLPFVAFRVQTAIEKDGDGLNDLWFFASADSQTATRRPTIDFTSVANPVATPMTSAPEPAAGMLAAAGLVLVSIGSRASRRRGNSCRASKAGAASI